MWLGPKGLEQGAEKLGTRHARLCRVMYGMQASSLLLMLCNQAEVAVGIRMIRLQLMRVLLPILSHTLQNMALQL